MHLVGLGREIIDPRSGRKVPVAGACTFGTSIEMILLELRVPYVLHALDPDNKAAWYGQMFEKTFTPAMYVGDGKWMQETADIVNKILADHAEQAVLAGLSERDAATGEVKVRPSLLPAEYTPMQNLLAGWYYCAYEPSDVGSVAYVESGSDEVLSAAERSAAFDKALDTCVEKLSALEEHLSKHAYCCGSAPGVDDIMRFLVLQILFVNLGELWGLDKPLYARLPHMRRWLLAMRGRDSNPFKHVHEDELYYRAHREWWTKKMPQRLFPSVEEEVARLRMKSVGSSGSLAAPASVEHAFAQYDTKHPQCVVLCEPSGETPDGPPSVQPEGFVHLVGLGREIIDPRSGRKVPVAGACTFGTSIEMILLELRVPYVLHALDPDNKAAWYGQMFEKTFTPAMYVGDGKWMQETADIVNKILADHAEQAVLAGLSERDAATGEVKVRPSLLPAEYTPMQNLLAGWYYCAYEPSDVGSVAYVESGSDEVLSAAERSAAFDKALDTCVEKLSALEEHLSKHAYCCGSAPGVDDIMRFLVLQILFVNLGELWGLDKPLYARLPHMRRWLLAMRGRDSNPFKHVHEDELYYRAHREWWTKKMPQRLFPSVEEEVARLRMKSVGSSGSLSPLQLRWSMHLRSTTRSILSVWCCASLAGRRPMGLRVCNRRALCTWWA